MMKKREFYCGQCGLFHWRDYSEPKGCPDDNCASNGEEGISRIYSVSSMAFAYYAKSHADEIRSIAWSSKLYAPDNAISYYKNQGMEIKL